MKEGAIDKLITRPAKDGILAELLTMGFDPGLAMEVLRIESIVSLADAVEFLLAGGSPQNRVEEGMSGSPGNIIETGVFGSCRNKTGAADGLEKRRDSGESATTRFTRQTLLPFKRKNSVELHGRGLVGESTLELLKIQRIYSPTTTNQPQLNQRKNVKDGLCMSSHVEVMTTIAEENPQIVINNAAQDVLIKYFGYSSLKPFQIEALKAWGNNKDSLVLAATGSGKSICFQLPALITGKVVVVISPLISLMHDQCLQLSKRGITACFLGSGQCDKTVEARAMDGMYSIVYLCPETLLRLISSLKQLASTKGIALFAIDEAHCISKWGHDFRVDYRRLSIIRETFYSTPIMALTATATSCVEADILDSLKINQNDAIVVRTTLFRPNLRFSVHHSKTSKPSSYKEDFKDLLDYYDNDQTHNIMQSKMHISCACDAFYDGMNVVHDLPHAESHHGSRSDSENCFGDEAKMGNIIKDFGAKNTEMSTTNFLGDDMDYEIERLGGDFSVNFNDCSDADIYPNQDIPANLDSVSTTQKGPTIVYVPTRKETETLSRFLCEYGLKAAPYHAKLPKQHLRKVHEQFHNGGLQVVVATVAFGMGINKEDVRNIIHYGWPQSLEAYYQEAGRAGRDGLASDCILFCDMLALPSLLPSKRDAEQTKSALLMLEQCFKYALCTSKCRAKFLLNYFGEQIGESCCKICDICESGPTLENLTKEAKVLLKTLHRLKEEPVSSSICNRQGRSSNQRKFQHAVDEINRGNEVNYRDRVWWRGFGRNLADLGYLEECDDKGGRLRRKMMVSHVRNPNVTAKGVTFLERESSQLLICPEGDMIQAIAEPRQPQSAKAWSQGWADPNIRKQRLDRIRNSRRNPQEASKYRSRYRRRQR